MAVQVVVIESKIRDLVKQFLSNNKNCHTMLKCLFICSFICYFTFCYLFIYLFVYLFDLFIYLFI